MAPVSYTHLLISMYFYGTVVYNKNSKTCFSAGERRPRTPEKEALFLNAKSTFQPQELEYLRLLAKQYPTVQAASTEIINLQAILGLSLIHISRKKARTNLFAFQGAREYD